MTGSFGFGFASYNFGNNTSPRIGLLAELPLSTNKNKWSVFFEPVFYSYKATTTSEGNNATIDHKQINFTIGARHYLFINNNTKFFLSAAFNYLTPSKSTAITHFGLPLNIRSKNGFVLGTGLMHKRLSGELQFWGPVGIISNLSWTSRYQVISLAFGYSLFK
jgi:hemolysin activation/secretion protein